jgi:hypothetical protein
MRQECFWVFLKDVRLRYLLGTMKNNVFYNYDRFKKDFILFAKTAFREPSTSSFKTIKSFALLRSENAVI